MVECLFRRYTRQGMRWVTRKGAGALGHVEGKRWGCIWAVWCGACCQVCCRCMPQVSCKLGCGIFSGRRCAAKAGRWAAWQEEQQQQQEQQQLSRHGCGWGGRGGSGRSWGGRHADQRGASGGPGIFSYVLAQLGGGGGAEAVSVCLVRFSVAAAYGMAVTMAASGWAGAAHGVAIRPVAGASGPLVFRQQLGQLGKGSRRAAAAATAAGARFGGFPLLGGGGKAIWCRGKALRSAACQASFQGGAQRVPRLPHHLQCDLGLQDHWAAALTGVAKLALGVCAWQQGHMCPPSGRRQREEVGHTGTGRQTGGQAPSATHGGCSFGLHSFAECTRPVVYVSVAAAPPAVRGAAARR